MDGWIEKFRIPRYIPTEKLCLTSLLNLNIIIININIVIIILTSLMAICFTSVFFYCIIYNYRRLLWSRPMPTIEVYAWKNIWRQTPYKPRDPRRRSHDRGFLWERCFMEPDCVSINLDKRVSGHGEYKCELNNVTHERHEHDLKNEDHYLYRAAEVGVASLANIHFK